VVSEVASRRETPTTAVEVNILTHDKGKRKIVDSVEAEKSCKFMAGPLVEKATLAIEATARQENCAKAERKTEDCHTGLVYNADKVDLLETNKFPMTNKTNKSNPSLNMTFKI